MADPCIPCIPYPENPSYLTIGLPACEHCGSHECWWNYLTWERNHSRRTDQGGLNAESYYLIDEYSLLGPVRLSRDECSVFADIQEQRGDLITAEVWRQRALERVP